eukprot:9483777-Pyramimonas_sp.AAC.1
MSSSEGASFAGTLSPLLRRNAVDPLLPSSPSPPPPLGPAAAAGSLLPAVVCDIPNGQPRSSAVS